MTRTTSLLTTGPLGLGSSALTSPVAPGFASANGCGVTTLDLAGLEAAFDGQLTGVGGGATAEMLTGGLHLTMPSAEADPDGAAYASYFMDGLGIPLAEATAQSNFDLDATLAAGQPVANHPTYELYVDLDGPGTDDTAQAILVHWEPEAGEPTDLWWSALGPLTALESESAEEADLVEISAAYPDAVVTSLGFQLLYQPGADVVVHGLTFGCNEFRLSSGSSGGPGGDPGGDPGGNPANQAPLAAVTATNTGATFTFSAAGSTDSDGTIAGYAWDFGNGVTAEGADVTPPTPSPPTPSKA